MGSKRSEAVLQAANVQIQQPLCCIGRAASVFAGPGRGVRRAEFATGPHLRVRSDNTKHMEAWRSLHAHLESEWKGGKTHTAAFDASCWMRDAFYAARAREVEAASFTVAKEWKPASPVLICTLGFFLESF